MTDWIKDNKLAAILLLVAILGVIGTYLYTSKKTAAYDEAKANFDQSASKLKQLEGRKPYPNTQNLEDRRKKVIEYRGKVEGLQKALLTFRPADFKRVTPAEFTTRLNEAGETLKQTYTEKGIEFPENWQLGFEVYTGSPPKDAATAYLNYQLGGLEWLYGQLAAAGPSALLNVYRPKLPVEDGEPMGGESPGKEKGRGRGRGQAQGGGEPFDVLPLELTFRGHESSVRHLLGTLAESKDHFFVVRSLRIQNVQFDKPPRLGDVEFEAAKPAGGDDIFSGFDFNDLPGEDSAPAGGGTGTGGGATDPAGGDAAVVPEPKPKKEEAGSERILGQVLGDEELHVFLQLELILFRGDVTLPEVK